MTQCRLISDFKLKQSKQRAPAGGPKNLFPCKPAKTPAIDSSRGADPNGVCVGHVRAFFCRVLLVAKKTSINPEGRKLTAAAPPQFCISCSSVESISVRVHAGSSHRYWPKALCCFDLWHGSAWRLCKVAKRAQALMRTLATEKPSAPVQQRRKRLRIPAGVKSLLRRVPSAVWTAAAGSGG